MADQIFNVKQLGTGYGVWEDLRVPITAIKLGGVNDPNFVKTVDDGAGSTGLFTYHFDKAAEEEVFFAAQLPHSYKEGSDISPHVHWAPTDTDTKDVIWGLEYAWVNINGTFTTSTIITILQAGSGTALKHQIAYFDDISGTGKTISSMLMCRLFRDATAALDDYDADASLFEFDFHYQRDTPGSQTESAK